ncbi:Nicotinate-nucleotide adenylyltransferase [Capillimicrobium parvum]|uniref:nicotinate-nucleotide adenylyltransferase n=2 Tax=Capillimicrobium parvum TaxID=2884022 RepID=A0A9E7C1L9_9ACTN|nr:Nicotinate-nucleotide adenylyltransferase [Capillimicrobium parvum]
MPVSVPPHKEADDDPGGEVRLALCEAAVAGDERLRVSRLELDRPGPSYTVDTLKAIHATSPGDDLTFIVGGDMAASLPEWRQPEELLELAALGVAERGETRRREIMQRISGLRAVDERVRFFSMPRIDVSSTDIRDRVRAGRPVRYLVPDDVARLIRARGLYPTEVPIR